MKKFNSTKTKAFPLQLVLIIPFVLQIFGAVSLVGYLSFKNGQKAVNDLADQLMARTSTMVDQYLQSYLSIPHKVNQINADAIGMGLLNVRDRKTIGKYFWKQMQAYDLSYIGIGLSTGEAAGAGRYDGKTLTIDDCSAKPPKNCYTYATDRKGDRTRVTTIYDWDNFSMSWYTGPIKAGRPIWSQIYTLNYPNHPYIAASAGRPIYDVQNRLLGIVATDIHLLKLSEFLRRLDVSRTGQVFILERNGMLIANSNPQQPFTLVKENIQRLKATDSPDPLIQDITQQIQQQFNGFQSISEPTKLQLKWQGEPNFVYISPWRDQYGLDWLVVVSVPEHTFMTQINANTSTTILLCLGALTVAILMGYLTSHLITQPIVRLNRASQAMAAGNLNQVVDVSNIQELNILAHSFNYMAGQLGEFFSALENSKAELTRRPSRRTHSRTQNHIK